MKDRLRDVLVTRARVIHAGCEMVPQRSLVGTVSGPRGRIVLTTDEEPGLPARDIEFDVSPEDAIDLAAEIAQGESPRFAVWIKRDA